MYRKCTIDWNGRKVPVYVQDKSVYMNIDGVFGAVFAEKYRPTRNKSRFGIKSIVVEYGGYAYTMLGINVKCVPRFIQAEALKRFADSYQYRDTVEAFNEFWRNIDDLIERARRDVGIEEPRCYASHDAVVLRDKRTISSIEFAREIGVAHRHVLRKIRQIVGPNDPEYLGFEKSSYVSPVTGATKFCFLMTKAGVIKYRHESRLLTTKNLINLLVAEKFGASEPEEPAVSQSAEDICGALEKACADPHTVESLEDTKRAFMSFGGLTHKIEATLDEILAALRAIFRVLDTAQTGIAAKSQDVEAVNEDFYTVYEFARVKGIWRLNKDGEIGAAKVGKLCVQLCKEKGFEVKTITSGLITINQYPASILKEAVIKLDYLREGDSAFQEEG